MSSTRIAQAVSNLDAWLDTVRADQSAPYAGYGGPVVHWWQNSLNYTGASLDWRYEGIISGYLTVWRRTAAEKWLIKAVRAGDDLVQGQLPNGNFHCSSFELNPYPAGTPHEAAADLGLLRLALALRTADKGAEAERYAHTALKNLKEHYLGRLWDAEAGSFRDQPHVPAIVPNKACTLTEALFAAAEWQQSSEWIDRYALPTLEEVLRLQLDNPKRLRGAIPQSRMRGEIVPAYFPFYIARCVPALLLAYRHTGEEKWRDGAKEALGFVRRHLDDDGRLPQVVYPDGVNRYPQWVAPLADVLRVASLMEDEPMNAWQQSESLVLAGQLPSGGIVTGRGFGSQVSQRFSATERPDFRDCIPVAGWVDKAFTYLAGRLPENTPLPSPELHISERPCHLRGRSAVWTETIDCMSLQVNGQICYQWQKGRPWAAVAAPEVMWK